MGGKIRHQSTRGTGSYAYGVMVYIYIHYVIHEVDRGEPIQVEYVDFKSGESLDELTERIHEVEHLIIVKGTGLAIVRLREERRKIALKH
jgi:folate-dependent phosphoribosylglycinamide formyltransferase PurN